MQRPVHEFIAAAEGRLHREDPVRERAGGPAGNARLTAVTGLLLLPLIAAEMLTLLRVRQLISWHIVIGVLLVPLVLLKIASTTWRIFRYYARDRDYRIAGPPPTVLRVLGPLVVFFSLALLGTGLALIALGDTSSRTTLATVVGHQVNAVTLHQIAFIGWAVVLGIHLLGRTVAAFQLALIHRSRLPGRVSRATTLAATVVVASLAAVLTLQASGSWKSEGTHRGDQRSGRPPGASGP